MGISGTPEATGNTLGGRRGITLRRVAVQSLADAVQADITWDTEDLDSDGFITVPSATITVPAGLGGLYAITMRGQVPTNPSVGSYTLVTAAGIQHVTANDQTGTVANRFQIGIVIPLLATETVVIAARQDHTGAQDFTGHLFMYRIGE